MFFDVPLKDSYGPIPPPDTSDFLPVQHIVDGINGTAQQLGGLGYGIAGFGHGLPNDRPGDIPVAQVDDLLIVQFDAVEQGLSVGRGL